jgi:hypothetical protein
LKTENVKRLGYELVINQVDNGDPTTTDDDVDAPLLLLLLGGMGLEFGFRGNIPAYHRGYTRPHRTFGVGKRI